MTSCETLSQENLPGSAPSLGSPSFSVPHIGLQRGKAGGGKKQLLNSLVGWAGDSEGKKLCQAEGQGGISEGVGCIRAGLQKEIECVVGQVQREYTTK